MLDVRTAAEAIDVVASPLAEAGLPPQMYMVVSETAKLVVLIKAIQPRTMLEIGCNEGFTAVACLREIPTLERYYGVDVVAGMRPMGLSVQNVEPSRRPGHYAFRDPRFILLLSRNGSFDLRPSDLQKVDAVFIDGDHSATAVRHDTDLARQVVRPGGIIVWHDYNNDRAEVNSVLHEDIKNGHRIMNVSGTMLAYEQVPVQ